MRPLLRPLLLFFLSLQLIRAQETDSLPLKTLPEVVIDADRLSTELQRSPLAITTVDQARLQQGQSQLSLSESLGPVPGVIAYDANNFAQDLRLSIRGFGARAAFGIRGVRVLVDGIPESTPDGQAQVDNIDLGIMQRLQVLQGPSSSLYGNASGGVVALQSEDIEQAYRLEARATLGSYGLQRYQLKGGLRGKQWRGLVYGAHTRLDGYRAHSSNQQTLLNGRFAYQPSDRTELTLLLNYVNSPLAQDPGGVDSAQFFRDPQAARARNVQFDGGERVTQGRAALKLRHELSGGGTLRAKAYFLQRDFANKLPFEFGGRVRLNRDYRGGGLSYRRDWALGAWRYRLQVGADLDAQADRRRQFRNLEGIEGELVGEQRETFTGLGVYWLNQLQLGERWLLQLNGRLDRLWLAAQDAFLRDGDDSGQRRYGQFNPSLGLSYAWRERQYLFGNFSTSFETPALSELSANPAGLAGFNPELRPQQARNFEAGLKGLLLSRLRYSATAYLIQVEDELVPFEIAGQQGRTFFRNAGSSQRLGAELYLSSLPWRGLSFTGSYAWQRFVYQDYNVDGVDLGGNRLAGIPPHSFYFEVAYTHPAGAYLRAWTQGRGVLWADDANQVRVPGYAVVNLRLGWVIEGKGWELEPFFGLNNLTDALYPGNVRINAARGLYFEAAPGRNVFGGVALRLVP